MGKYINSKFNMSLDEIAEECCVTRSRIGQIEARALRKLRHPKSTKMLKEFCCEEASSYHLPDRSTMRIKRAPRLDESDRGMCWRVRRLCIDIGYAK